jgi:hypothetical protein
VFEAYAREDRISNHEIKEELQIFAIQDKILAYKRMWKEHFDGINIYCVP